MYVHRKGQPSRRTAAAVQQPRVIDTPLRKMLQHKAGLHALLLGQYRATRMKSLRLEELVFDAKREHGTRPRGALLRYADPHALRMRPQTPRDADGCCSALRPVRKARPCVSCPSLLVCGGRLFTARKKAVLCVVKPGCVASRTGRRDRGISEELSHHAAQRCARSHLSHARHVLS